MNAEMIRATLMFLSRVDIKGGEAMAMVQICQALETMLRTLSAEAARRSTNGAADEMPDRLS